MVYESDFYTYRRPYSRPLVSSYSVTGPYTIPSTSYHVLNYSPYMPYAAHKRLVSFVHTPIRIYHAGTSLPIRLYSQIRPSVLSAELNRIRYLTRPSYEPYTSNYLNSRKYLDFDDETREIRARANSLMRRIHVFVPRPSPRVNPYSVLTSNIGCISVEDKRIFMTRLYRDDYADEVLPEKMHNSAYVRRILNTPRTYPVKQLEYLPWYFTELRHLGDGRLACVKYVAGKPVSRRRPYYTLADIRAGDVKSDVNLMSYYLKNRRAAEDASSKERPNSRKGRAEAPVTKTAWNDVPEETETQKMHDLRTETEPAVQAEAQIVQDEKPEKADVKSTDNEIVETEDDVKKQPDEETIRMVQEYIAKKLEEERLEEERKRAEEEVHERLRREREAQRLAEEKLAEQRRLAEILAQEKLLAEQRAEEARAEAARQEAARIAQEEKIFAEAVAAAITDEQERIAKEHTEDEERRRQEEEERLVTDASADAANDDGNNLCVEELTSSHAELSDQEKEAKPYDVDENDLTEVEEEDLQDEQCPTSPFPEEIEAAESQAILAESTTDSVQVEESTRGGEKAAEESGEQSQPEAEESGEQSQPEVEESGEQSQPEAEETVVDEPHVEVETNEPQIEEVEEEEVEEEVEQHAVQEEEEVAEEEPQEEEVFEEVDDFWGTHGEN